MNKIVPTGCFVALLITGSLLYKKSIREDFSSHDLPFQATSEVVKEKTKNVTNSVTGNLKINSKDHMNLNIDSQKDSLKWMIPAKEYHEYFALKSKALVSKEDKYKFLDLLSSDHQFDVAINQVMNGVNESKFTKGMQQNRIMAISYLSSVMNSKFDSKNKDRAIKFSLKLLNNQDAYDIENIDLKRSLIGDKVEIGMALALLQPKQWKKYKEGTTSEREIKVINKVEENIELYGKKLMQELSSI